MISGDKNYNGVIDELVNGSWISQTDNKQYGIPIKNIEIRKTLDGRAVSYTHLTLPTKA